MSPSVRKTRSVKTSKRPKPVPAAPGPPLCALLRDDPALMPFQSFIEARGAGIRAMEERLTGGRMTLADFASGHEYFGLHREGDGWVLREWAPNASRIHLVGDFSGWKVEAQNALRRCNERGDWEIRLPSGRLKHGDSFKLVVEWPGGAGERIPAWARRVIQNSETHLMAAQVWAPDHPYEWKHPGFTTPAEAPRIYEAHVGMAQEDGRVGTFREFTGRILPRVVAAGYNTLQLMAILEHPYYGSFGYHVTNFFAVSSRFGTPEEFKELVDTAHGMGVSVIIDLVHSHAARNEAEGLGRWDGTLHQYFHEGARGMHVAWDSRCFDYGKPEVLHFLLSNCRFWLDEYRLDGYRFDGVTSLLYRDHGLGRRFASYADYFSDNLDPAAEIYLGLANRVIHQVRPSARTIAEDVSGLPGLATPLESGGLGFDYRLAMGTPDYWIKLLKEVPDEQWPVGHLFHELTARRRDEKIISYAESHDQALVGDQTLIFRLIGAEMYTHMSVFTPSLKVDRGMALHKMIRLITLATAGNGYLNFMGNEFGHPEWIDFPREGNQWSYHYARRQWHLLEDPTLRYRFLAAFDRDLMAWARDGKILDTPDLRHSYEHVEFQLLAFRRGRFLLFFNFSPQRSVTDWPIPVPAGTYRLVFDTDQEQYGGQGRIRGGQEYHALPDKKSSGEVVHRLMLYSPARTALILESVGVD